jgi:acyl-coenzyme A thioesterase PaaI-like protein
MDTDKILQKAKSSSFYRWVLNLALDRMVPFNKPHGFRVVEIGDHRLKIRLPYRRKNLNHIRGLHACAMATVSEFTTGFLLISKLDPKKYRLIMQRLEMDYHYQGKMDAHAEFVISPDWLEANIFGPLKTKESVVVNCQVPIHDVKGNHLSTGHVHWQIKDWGKVKTKT